MTTDLEGAVELVRRVLAEARDRNPWLRLMAVENEIDTILDALASITRERDEAREENKRLRTEHEDARTALEDLQIEYGHAQREALELATWLHRTFYADVADWKPFTAASSLMTQIDNMVAGVNQRLINIEKRATKAEAERGAMREALKLAQCYTHHIQWKAHRDNVARTIHAALVNGEGGE